MFFHSFKLNWFCTGQSWLTSWGYRTDPPVDNAELLQWGNEAANAIKSLYGTKYDVGSAGSTLYLAGRKYKLTRKLMLERNNKHHNTNDLK